MSIKVKAYLILN